MGRIYPLSDEPIYEGGIVILNYLAVAEMRMLYAIAKSEWHKSFCLFLIL